MKDLREKAGLTKTALARAGEFSLPSLGTRALVTLGDARLKGRLLRDAIEAYEQALEGDPPEGDRGMTVASLASAYRAMGDLTYAGELVEAHLKQERGAPLDPGVLAELQTILVSIYFERGEVVRAERTAERAVAAGEQDAPAHI